MDIKKGDRIELIYMKDPYTNLKFGDRGTCMGIDDIGNILMNWDSGSSLSLIPKEDRFQKIEESLNILKYNDFK